MKLKQMTSYILKDMLKVTALFYGILVLILLLFTLLLTMTTSSGTMGTGSATMIFLFVLGIVAFYKYVKTGFTFSVSRRTVFLSLLLSGVVVAALAGVVDTLIAWLGPLLLYQQGEIIIYFGEFFVTANTFVSVVSTLCYYLVGALVSLTVGYFVGGLYYRMNKGLKIAVSVGVPITCFVALPILLSMAPPVVVDFLQSILIPLSDFLSGSPLNMALFFLLIAAVCTFFVWLLIRKAPVKVK